MQQYERTQSIQNGIFISLAYDGSLFGNTLASLCYNGSLQVKGNRLAANIWKKPSELFRITNR